MDAGRIVGRRRRGSVLSGTPPTEYPARTAASDGQRAFTRASRQRRAQVCGEVNVRSNGQGNNKVRRPGWHLIHRGAVPLQHKARLRQPSIGEGLMRRKVGETASIERTASGTLPLSGAGRGGVGGVHPSAYLKARTAASDGHCAFTRAARSAGLRFAVRSLSKAIPIATEPPGKIGIIIKQQAFVKACRRDLR